MEDEIYEEFGSAAFGGVYYHSILAGGENRYYWRTPGGSTDRINEHQFAVAKQAWEDWDPTEADR